jgi:glycosyltransferase involved in cell wall biosynthesis
LRVLVLASCRWWNATAEGAVLQAAALSRAGVECIFGGSPGSPALSRAAGMGLGTLGLGLEGAGFLSGAVRLARALRAWRPDWVVTHRSEDHLAAVLLSGAPVARVRSDIRRPSPGFLPDFVDCRTSLVVFSSRFMIREGYQGRRRGPTAVIPQPVDTDRFRPAARPGTRTLVALGRLSEVKGHRVLIRALAARRDLRAVIAGAPAQHSIEDLASLASSLGVEDRLELPGFVEDIPALLARADLGVVTSLASEAVSRAALEMMSSGLPVLAAATNGLVDTVSDGRTGLLHPPGDHETLAAQAGYLLDNPAVIGAMSRAAVDLCRENYSLAAVGAAWLSALAAGGGGEQIRPGPGIKDEIDVPNEERR